MGGTCSTNKENEKCMDRLGQKTSRNESTWDTKPQRWRVFMELGSEGVGVG
jgi:hypothetical protein